MFLNHFKCFWSRSHWRLGDKKQVFYGANILLYYCTDRCLYYESSYTFHIGADNAAQPMIG